MCEKTSLQALCITEVLGPRVSFLPPHFLVDPALGVSTPYNSTSMMSL